jgi:tubulin--tyrosine ligase
MEAAPGKLWILKPSLANKGAEVTVVKSIDDVTRIVRTWSDVREWVLQTYVDRPLLVARRKFHLRAYVLLVGCMKVRSQ